MSCAVVMVVSRFYPLQSSLGYRTVGEHGGGRNCLSQANRMQTDPRTLREAGMSLQIGSLVQSCRERLGLVTNLGETTLQGQDDKKQRDCGCRKGVTMLWEISQSVKNATS